MTVGAWIKTLQQFDEGLEVIVRMSADYGDGEYLFMATKPQMKVDAGCEDEEVLCIDMTHEDEGVKEIGRLPNI